MKLILETAVVVNRGSPLPRAELVAVSSSLERNWRQIDLPVAGKATFWSSENAAGRADSILRNTNLGGVLRLEGAEKRLRRALVCGIARCRNYAQA